MFVVLLFLIYIILCMKTIKKVDKILDKKNLSAQEYTLNRMIIKFAILFILTILIVILGLILHILL